MKHLQIREEIEHGNQRKRENYENHRKYLFVFCAFVFDFFNISNFLFVSGSGHGLAQAAHDRNPFEACPGAPLHYALFCRGGAGCRVRGLRHATAGHLRAGKGRGESYAAEPTADLVERATKKRNIDIFRKLRSPKMSWKSRNLLKYVFAPG